VGGGEELVLVFGLWLDSRPVRGRWPHATIPLRSTLTLRPE